jgi:hypothetical protein
MGKHYTKVEYFSKYSLFTVIYLLLDQKLNHNNQSGQKTNMKNVYKLLSMICTFMQNLEVSLIMNFCN